MNALITGFRITTPRKPPHLQYIHLIRIDKPPIRSFHSSPVVSGAPQPSPTITQMMVDTLPPPLLPSETLSMHPLSKEQTAVLNLLISGKNVYFTGKAGTGKTQILRHFQEHLKTVRKPFAITIKGQTLHSFSSIPVTARPVDVHDLAKYIKTRPSIYKKYTVTQTLVVDEISMISPWFFDLFDRVCQKVRGNTLPFGGMQIILCGDFFQLPPVHKTSRESAQKLKSLEPEHIPFHSDLLHAMNNGAGNCLGVSHRLDDGGSYLFESRAWRDLLAGGMELLELQQGFRQTDPYFSHLLDDLRMGVTSKAMWDLVQPCYERHSRDWWKHEGLVVPTFLTGYRHAADDYNDRALFRIKQPLNWFTSVDYVSLKPDTEWKYVSDSDMVDVMLGEMQAPNHLRLKIGSQVILLRNVDVSKNLANGTRGVVEEFRLTHDEVLDRVVSLPVVRFSTGQAFVVGYHEFTSEISSDGMRVTRCQIPLALGWGITIHKSQGMTLDHVILDMPSAFAPGHAYVAIGRVKTLEGLSFKRFSEKSVFVSAKVAKFYEAFQNRIKKVN